jgi:hypothetical protein
MSPAGMREVRPLPRLARRKIGSVVRSVSLSRSEIASAMARCCAWRKPWVRTMAFGWPVLPLVKVTSAGVSEAAGAVSAVAGAELMSEGEPMRGGDAEKRAWTPAAGAGGEVRAALRGIDEKADEAGLPSADEEGVEFARHRLEHEHAVAGAQAARAEAGGDAGGGFGEFAVGPDAILAGAVCLDDGGAFGMRGGAGAERGGEVEVVHGGERRRAKRA